MGKTAIIIGAGPAGLTAAYELLKRTDIKPVILEKSGDIGGISKTINYKGNRMDIGGHRFFSKSDRVMNWWLNIMPLQKTEEENLTINYQNKTRSVNTNTNPEMGAEDKPGLVMLVRKRLSRIYFLRKFFNYPIQLSLDTLKKLGFVRTMQIILSYSWAQLFRRKPEKSLEDFLINRFGKKLYLLFFKDYTEKVWGVPCNEISAEWGAQRIKGVSISSAIKHAAQSIAKKKKNSSDIAQKDTETSLIEQFLYPALGPGQLWEEVARQVEVLGGKIMMHEDVKEICINDKQVTSVITVNSETGEQTEHAGDYFFSTMPVQELIAGMNGVVPADVKEVAAGLQYRDFITVGVLLKKFGTTNEKVGESKGLQLKDTWIYVQEKDVKVGRLQLFNNWSPFMVNTPDNVWIGMEYFCNKGDGFWELNDEEIQKIAIGELAKMGLAEVNDVLDSTVHRVEKTYPAYFGTYGEFDKVRDYTDQLENLFLVGRNGMHKYNNADHSMLTAMTAVDNICGGVKSKDNVWEINTEHEYHEEKTPKTHTQENIFHSTPITTPTDYNNLKDYVFRNPSYKWFIRLGIGAIILQFIFFKYLYPFASFINGDSYAYLETAYHNYSINTYPVGYSNFLRLFSVFTKSDTALVAFQYLLIQGSSMGLIFTMFYFFQPGRVVKVLLFSFILFNPIFLYLANYVSSDALFISLSIIWFSQLIWITYRPTTSMIVLNSLVLFIAFTVRYNALYYPLITLVVLLLCRYNVWRKLVGSIVGIIFISLFINFTSNKYYELTGTRQFSPFSGWQLSNNVMYVYRYLDGSDIRTAPPRLRKIDRAVRTYFDTTRDLKKYPHEELLASPIYMWSPISPLQQYMKQKFKNDTMATSLKKWASMGPLYSDYGKYLIRTYPLTFAKYFLLPNAMKYYAPPVEFLEYYNSGIDSIAPAGIEWFNYKTAITRTRFKNIRVTILNFYPVLSGIFNVIFLCSSIGFVLLQGNKKRRSLGKGLLIVAIFWITNFLFSVFASPIALRFQLFPILVLISFSFMLLEFLFKEAKKPRFAKIELDGPRIVTSAQHST